MSDWREDVVVHDDVYVYQAALYCDSCGEAIRKELEDHDKVPEDPNDESSYDSDDFPKGPFSEGGGEADSPQHCDCGEKCLNAITLPCGSKIGAWLGNPLTEEGTQYVIDLVIKDMASDDLHARQVGRLWRYVYADQLDQLYRLRKATLWSHAKEDKPDWCDLDCLYGINHVTEVKLGPVIRRPIIKVWRSCIDPEGNFSTLQWVELDPEVFKGVRPESILMELIEEGAWD